MVSQTRTESAIDYESTPLYVTTLRNATLTETISPTRPPYNTTSPGTGGTFYILISISSSPFISNGVDQRQVKTTAEPQSVLYNTVLYATGWRTILGSGFQRTPRPDHYWLEEPTCSSCLQQCASKKWMVSLQFADMATRIFIDLCRIDTIRARWSGRAV